MKQDRLLQLARNALMVAGHEMGKEGDHWPVIKATIAGITKDYEELQIERAVSAELEEHMGDIVCEYEEMLASCDNPALRAELEPVVREMRDVYEANFAPVDHSKIGSPEDKDAPGFVPWRSAGHIIKSLMEKN
ncbi:MAG: hypothetical protein GC131_00680 [Alphaproteobacteria bacterium]|nr:hypothetical protein [Alphaproteobacteria bacterium]